MSKLGLIIKREYWTRVTKKAFILATLLTPLGIGLYFLAIGYLTTYQGDEDKRIAIFDQHNILGLDERPFKDMDGLYFRKTTKPVETLKEQFSEGAFDAILEIPKIEDLNAQKFTVNYYSEDERPLSLALISQVQRRIESRVRSYKIDKFGLDRKQLSSIETDVRLQPKSSKGEEDSKKGPTVMTSAIAAGIGGFMGVMMYFVVFIYGMMVMRSVMEEKTSRIVEVMISSVKPFQLMLGKIIGVGLVGLTQLTIWGILIPIIIILIQIFFGFDAAEMQQANMQQATAGIEIDQEDAQSILIQSLNELKSQNWLVIIPLFLFYFIGGYFMYASLFAAVGSAMGDDLGEGQSLTIPITIPVIIAFFIMFMVIQNPNSSLATWSSIFPLFSPIVMPARLAFSPPLWEILLSMLVLAASVVFFIWLSAKIYRVGILMYGKKVTLKEIWKWIKA